MASTQLPATVSSATYNSDNQLTQLGATRMTYDANGNTLSDGMTAYVWDARNRLVSANNSGAIFAYDALGRRTDKDILSVNSNVLYDGVTPVQELNGSTITANLLTGGVDEYFTRTDSSGTSNFLTDALGSTIALTDTSGNSQVQYSYGPFGNISITGTTNNTYTYTGRETDGLGLYYYRARYYNPQTGGFLSEDPLQFEGGGPDFYAYALNDPLYWVDPSGLDVTIVWLNGLGGNPSGHIALEVNNDGYVGLENVPGTDLEATMDFTVPGIIKAPADMGSGRQVWDSVTIHTTSAQDLQMERFIAQQRKSSGKYKLTGRNCSTWADNVLNAAGIHIPSSIKPKNFMHDLHQACANGTLSCAH